MKFAALEGRIARARAQFVFADAERFVRINQNEIGWCALGESACIQSKNVSGRRRECAQRKTETDAAVGAGFGTGAAGEVASGARRVQAAKPNAATDPTILQTTCRRVNASMRGPLSVLSPRHA